MFKNYIITALRNLFKNKLYTLINISGLTLGLTSTMLILLFIIDETTYDDFWPQVNDIYRLNTTEYLPDGTIRPQGQAPRIAKDELVDDFDEILAISHTFVGLGRSIRVGDKDINTNLTFADKGFTEIFHLDYIEGSQETAMTGPNSAALNISTAQTLFGEGPYLGKTFSSISLDRTFEVTAIFKDLPTTSNLARLKVLLEMQVADWSPFMQKGMNENWEYILGDIWVRLIQGSQVDKLNAQLPDFLERNVTELPGFVGMKPSEALEFELMNIQDVHLSKFSGFGAPAISTIVLGGITLLAVLILVIAGVNFINLSLAQIIPRQKEIALRKVMGAKRSQIIIQYLGESILVSLFALLLALGMVEMVIPLFEDLMSHKIQTNVYSPEILIYFIELAVLFGILAGLYPALVISSAHPIKYLSGGKGVSNAGGKLKTFLVMFQFVVAIGLVISTTIVQKQILHSESFDKGFKTEGLLSIIVGTGEGVYPNVDALITKIKTSPEVKSMSHTWRFPIAQGFDEISVLVPNAINPGPYDVGFMDKGYDYFKTLGLELLVGREHEEMYASAKETIVISESASKLWGFETPSEAMGQLVNFNKNTLEVIGVVPDIKLTSTKETTPPMIYGKISDSYFQIMVRVLEGREAEFANNIEKIWSDIIPDRNLRISYFDEEVSKMYRTEKKTAEILTTFSFISLLVSGLGLFGLAAFSAQCRTKEIGIRKVFGAGLKNIIPLMMWQFSKPVIAANIIAWPLAWYFMDEWLTTFVARIELGPVIFIMSGLGVLAMSWLTVAGHAFYVARQNPITALRYE